MLTDLIQFLKSHPYTALSVGSVAATWIFNNIVTVLVSELPAPTKDSTGRYIYWFKVANSIVGNLKRAHSTAIEQSPNWQAAVNAHIIKLADSGFIIGRPADGNIASSSIGLPKQP